MAGTNWNNIVICLPIAILSFLTAKYIFKSIRFSRAYPLPPGPIISWPRRGRNILPESYQWKTYTKWREVYGDLLYINVWGSSEIIINSSRVARDLLEKRSVNYSSRPERPMLDKLMGWEWAFSSAPYGESWRNHRRLFQKYFNPNLIASYQPIQTREVHTLLKSLCDNPDNFFYHIRRTSAAIVVMISYGYQIRPEGDWFVKQADEALATIAYAGTFGTYLVDYLPLLRHVPTWLPGASFKRQAQKWKRLVLAMVDRPFDMVKEKMKQGSVIASLATSELELLFNNVKNAELEEVIKNVSAISYSGGTDTTTSTILSFFLAMTLHSDIQERAQNELDSVTEGKRLPTFEDREKLPYVDCILKECLRWNPVTPLSLAHTVMEDDVYMGMRIPKGTQIIPNVWGMLHDESVYPDPFKFHPDRFLQNGLTAAKDGTDLNPYPMEAFGFGRRICPGRFLAESTIWITIACVLSIFNISKQHDENGQEITPEVLYTSAILSHPEPFKCSISLRSMKCAQILEELTL